MKTTSDILKAERYTEAQYKEKITKYIASFEKAMLSDKPLEAINYLENLGECSEAFFPTYFESLFIGSEETSPKQDTPENRERYLSELFNVTFDVSDFENASGKEHVTQQPPFSPEELKIYELFQGCDSAFMQIREMLEEDDNQRLYSMSKSFDLISNGLKIYSLGNNYRIYEIATQKNNEKSLEKEHRTSDSSNPEVLSDDKQDNAKKLGEIFIEYAKPLIIRDVNKLLGDALNDAQSINCKNKKEKRIKSKIERLLIGAQKEFKNCPTGPDAYDFIGRFTDDLLKKFNKLEDRGSWLKFLRKFLEKFNFISRRLKKLQIEPVNEFKSTSEELSSQKISPWLSKYKKGLGFFNNASNSQVHAENLNRLRQKEDNAKEEDDTMPSSKKSF